jgi:soluble lytic murein transglycosylase-like protein
MALLALPATAGIDSTPPAVSEEDVARAEAELAATLARIDAVGQDVEDADRRAAAAAAALGEVRRELATAAASADAAEAAAAEAGGALAIAIEALDDDRDALAAAQQEVDDRAATLFMRGTDGDRALLVGLLGVTDVHDVFVRVRAFGRQSERDAASLSQGRDLVLVGARDRDALGRIRSRAAESTARAVRSREQASSLVARQEGLVADAARAADDRRTALAALEQDATARATLVDVLSTRILEQRLGDLAAWLGDPANVPVDAAPPAWAAALPPAGREIAPAIVHAAARAGIDPRLLAALVWTESSFDPAAVSSAGALGLAQLMPPTAAGLGVDPRDPIQNLVGGARYLRIQLDRFGRVDLALAAYNAGPSRVERAGGIPDIVQTELYVLRVLDRVERLGGPGGTA